MQKNNLKKLLADITLTCIENNINLNFIAEKSILTNNIECSGFFDEKNLSVSILKKTEHWLPILIHESCHMDQFLDKKFKFRSKEKDPIHLVDSWLNGKKYTDCEIKKAIQESILLELDCEKRSVKKYIKYKINFDQNLYIQKANAYVFSYWATYRDKKWYPFPYQNKKIYNNMPSIFLPTDYYLTKYEDYIKLYT